jgi:outer membrane biosynthesis protein TonB
VIGSFAVHWRAVAVAAFSFGAAACTGQTRETTNPLVASLIFDNASPDAREALTSPIDYRITEDNFSRWQEAQENLDQLPRSSIRSSPASGRTAVDRAVARLQSSPPARQAIESAGISVREFVLETIALAQATESAQTGKSTSPMPILADNYQFVRQYRAGGLRAESTEPPESPETPEPPEPAEPPEPPEPPEPSAESSDMQPEMQAEVREQESAEARLQVDAMNAERTAQAESEHAIRELQERMQRKIEAAQERYRRKPSRARRDAARDSWGDSRESLRRSSRDSLSDSLPERR